MQKTTPGFVFKVPKTLHSRRSNARRDGSVLTMLAGLLPLIFLSCGMVIDLGLLQTMRSQAQRAADAAALAGAMASDGKTNSNVIPEGEKYAKLNGRLLGNGTSDPNYWDEIIITANYQNSPNKVRAEVKRSVQVYFAPVFERFMQFFDSDAQDPIYSRNIAASAVAQRFGEDPKQLSTGGFYGIADPNASPANQSVFGPFAYYNWGDPYSVRYLEDGSPNTEHYDPEGFSYTINTRNLKSTDGKVHIEIYDPDTYSVSGNSYDEVRPPNTNIPNLSSEWGGDNETTTRFTLWDTRGTADTKDDIKINEETYKNDPSTNEKWVVPEGFDVTASNYNENLRLQVQSLDGSSENGYKLRAGPTEGLGLDDIEWNKRFGDNNNTNRDNVMVPIVAEDKIQMNFTQSGNTRLELGFVPASDAGKEIQIRKFDVDVGSVSITYSSDGTAQTFAGTFPDQRNGTWSTDSFRIPDDFTGGMFYATYIAGAQDTSAWKMVVLDPGKPGGKVRLIR